MVIFMGRLAPLQDFVAVEVGERHLGRGDEREPVALDAVVLVLELGELPGAGHAVVVDDEGAEDLGVAVLLRVEVQHEVDDGPLHPRREPHVHVEARAGELHAPLEVEDAHLDAEVVVRLRREGEFRLFAPGAHHRVVLFALSFGDRRVEEVGHARGASR